MGTLRVLLFRVGVLDTMPIATPILYRERRRNTTSHWVRIGRTSDMTHYHSDSDSLSAG